MRIQQNPALEVIPSGIPQLDKLMGVGGYPRKYLVMLSGQPGSGKTTIAIQSILEAQKRGLETLYVETDYKFVPSYFETLGVNLGLLTVLQEEIGETLLEEVQTELGTGKYALCIIDTVSKITPRSELEKDFDGASIGRQAMLIGRFLRKLKPLANRHNTAVVLLNHERVDFMNNGKIKTPGGEAIQEDVVIWLRLSHTGENILKNGVVVGKRIKAKIWRKNQVAATEGHETVLEVFPGQGFSKTADLLDTAIDKGIITKEGQFYFFSGLKVGRGLNGLREALKDDDLQQRIIDALSKM